MFRFWLIIISVSLITAVVLVYFLLKNNRSRLDKVISVAIMVFLPVGALLLYHHWGAMDALSRYWTAQLTHVTSPEQVVEELKNHLKDHPNSAKGWYLLGRLYLGQNEFMQAKAVLSKAHELKPNNPEYTVAYAEAAFFADGKKLNTENRALLNQVLNRFPNNIGAVNLLAIDAYNQEHYSEAVHYWERLLPFFSADSEEEKMLLKMIAEAQKKIKE